MDTLAVQQDMNEYLQQRLAYNVEKKRSRQTMETLLSALGKLEYAINHYIKLHDINAVPLDTDQYSLGRGSHGLKHNFAQERYLECIRYGLSHEQALQQTSLETSHFRLRETLTYTRG